jgi:hypothetical protein
MKYFLKPNYSAAGASSDDVSEVTSAAACSTAGVCSVAVSSDTTSSSTTGAEAAIKSASALAIAATLSSFFLRSASNAADLIASFEEFNFAIFCVLISSFSYYYSSSNFSFK